MLDSDTMLVESIDMVLDSSAHYMLTTTPDWNMMEGPNPWPPIQSGFLLFNPSLIAHRYKEVLALISGSACFY